MTTTTQQARSVDTCDPASRVTRSLLGYGVIAGPLYVGGAFLAGFAVIASGTGSSTANVVFTVAVIAVFAWLAAVSIHLYRHTAQ